MKLKLHALLQSRRFWAAAAGLLAVLGQDLFGVELATDQLVAIASIVVAWIIGDTLRETK